MSKLALISGTTGQDGSYLAELLLEKNYVVYGIIRRTSLINTHRVDHLYKNKKFHLAYGDVTDSSNILSILQKMMQEYPDFTGIEIYNLAAQSHVKVSFDEPSYTAHVDALGTLNMLEAIRVLNLKDRARFYQASTSELFGKVQEVPQTETTPFYPRSPYGVAKLYGFWIVKNYREAYGIHASNGVLFNHETVSESSPMIYKRADGGLDIKPIGEICRNDCGVNIDENNKIYQSGAPTKTIEIWDKNDWTTVKYVSCYPHNIEKDNKSPKIINARNSVIMATGEHVFFKENDREVACRDIKIGDKLRTIKLPVTNSKFLLNDKLCFLLGALVGDGYISDRGDIRFTSKNENDIKLIEDIWVSLDSSNSTHKRLSTSGFTGLRNIWQLHLKGNKKLILDHELYNEDNTKRVPYQILNSSHENMIEFLKGYNLADGLKAGHCVYEFKNFKTNSPVLAQGLTYLLNQTTKQKINITVEPCEKWGYKTFYYSINILSNSKCGQNCQNSQEKLTKVLELLGQNESQRSIARITGISRSFISKVHNGYVPPLEHHLAKSKNEVKKIIDYPDYDGWFYDLETESGTFHCGIGYGHVHNSPRRGETFLTRKVTIAIGKIVRGEQDHLCIGNLDAKRDWGYAKDYVEGMWRMLQQETPDDYVLATGECHSVREFVEKAFRAVGIEIIWEGEGVNEVGKDKNTGKILVKISEKYFRPAEVDLLLGDASKAKRVLGWTPKMTFDELVATMVQHDVAQFNQYY
jgi:GDP-D-mannose dehydratase